ncbi:hypothetical protein FEM48_Zijuj05G0189100 [Ziziphus jujuba var. spinosa]|uniref:Legume lectin domain-containing protein n=1 Tax=Ziziphus jujuba var. spinosa TaxID=714518 RepID=A0A978VGJ7_ZIZJJ|nr:hypothetical protein FEM48_Zijuj05G0189100 [Ziziphus jujuba var. spinosa]
MTRPLNDGSKIHVAINYIYSTNNFSVTLSFLESSSSNDHGSFNIWTLIDIPRVMPEYATVGFAAGTGTYTQKHEVLSWEFNSTESPAGEREINSTGWSPAGNNEQGRMNNVAVVVGPVVGGFFIIVVIGLFYWRRAQGVVEFEDQEGTSGFENAMNREFDHNTGPRSDASLAAWVWEMYGEDRVVDVVDKRLGMEFEAKELECLVNVGLWCAHPDHTLRPSIRQALQVLKFEAHFPDLPKSMPPPNYNLGSLEEEPPVPSSAAAHNSLSFTSINVGR